MAQINETLSNKHLEIGEKHEQSEEKSLMSYGKVNELLGDYTPSKIDTHIGINPIQIRKKLLPLDNDELHFVELERKPSTFDSALLSNKGNLCTLELYRPCDSILKTKSIAYM